MQTTWFWLVSVMMAIYVVLDGFDFGAGVLHLWIAKNDRERRHVLAAIGPLWDGNEVWLLAGGGSLFLAFPKVLATGFSGFYLAMFMVVWTLILRGISIEFRSHIAHPIWRQFWDFVFGLASTLMPILLGCALGNVVRGVPLDATGFFNIPLFTSFRPNDPQPGILDIYTLFVGVFALVIILAHGASFLAWKTDGDVGLRARAIRQPLYLSAIVLFVVVTMLTMTVRPSIFVQARTSPMAWMFVLVTLASVGSFFYGHSLKKDFFAFIGTAGTILGLLGATAASVFPVMLKSTIGEQFDLTVFNASSNDLSLATGMRWWFVGFPIAIAYFAYIFYLHREKAKPAEDGEGY